MKTVFLLPTIKIVQAVFLVLTIFILVVPFPISSTEACWAGLTTEELVEQSGLIVIGAIKGPSGTEKVGGVWETRWDVEVQYFLKGASDNSRLTVATQGAKNKQPSLSTHYHLDEWGETVLLFLAERNGRFEPLSPQGVVALSPNDLPPQDQPNGEYLMKKYSIIDDRTLEEDKKELEKYLAGLPRATAATAEVAAEGLDGRAKSKQSASVGIIGGAEGPTSIYVSGNPLKALVTPAIIFTATIFAGGFALGYFIRARRLK